VAPEVLDAENCARGARGEHRCGGDGACDAAVRTTALNRDEDRLRQRHEPGAPDRGRGGHDLSREGPAATADTQVRVEQRRLELRELVVDAQRCPRPSAFTPVARFHRHQQIRRT
jgi:hypothetical protein